MNTEMLKREELNDAKLDEVTGGSFKQDFCNYCDYVWETGKDAIHRVAQTVADATR